MPEEFDIYSLVSKLMSSGLTLGDLFGDRVHTGIKTGLNKAFIIDTETRDALVAADPNSAEIIRPWLRGRDIKRWKAEWAGLWVIAIASSNDRDWPWSEAENQKKAEAIFAKEFPAIHAHLLPFRNRARKRHDKGRFWFELRSCSYYEAFERAKIIWSEIPVGPKFAFDESGYFCDAAGCIIPLTDESEAAFLLALLNSPVMQWHHQLTSGQIRGEFNGYTKQYVLKMPSPGRRESSEREIGIVMGAIDELIGHDPSVRGGTIVPSLEAINELVYWMYDLDPSEIEIIERATGLRDDDGEVDDASDATVATVHVSFDELDLEYFEFAGINEALTSGLCRSFFQHWQNVRPDTLTRAEAANSEQWFFSAFTVEYEEGSWDFVIKAACNLMIAGGTLAYGTGHLASGVADLIEAQKKSIQKVIHSSIDDAIENVNIDQFLIKDIPDPMPVSMETMWHRSESDVAFSDLSNDAEAVASLPASIDSPNAQIANRRVELHIATLNIDSGYEVAVIKPEEGG